MAAAGDCVLSLFTRNGQRALRVKHRSFFCLQLGTEMGRSRQESGLRHYVFPGQLWRGALFGVVDGVIS